MSKEILSMLRKEYTMRLLEALTETDLLDKGGKVVVGAGLKVRHKDSQYEYTVDSVEQGPDGEYKVKLRNPDAPRFEPAESDSLLGEEDGLLPSSKSPIGNDEPVVKVNTEPSEEPLIGPDDVIVIDQAEFEKDYEVK
tara:strand:+ start:626 stop:1039 length:414 start_codon:yes stop_codon:yes gene_type:complete